MEPDKDEIVDLLFSILETLIIEDCFKLLSAPSYFPSLSRLEIKKNDHFLQVKKILSKVTNLSTLEIIGENGMIGLTCLSYVALRLLSNNHHHPNIKFLRLHRCTDLTTIRDCGTSLKRLELLYCDNLRDLSGDLCT